jgi:hypothetical protein
VSLAGPTLHVADVERSLTFYRDIPGAEVMCHLPDRFALLKFSPGRLGLLADQKRQLHVELKVPDLDAAVVVALRERGVEAEGPTTRPLG